VFKSFARGLKKKTSELLHHWAEQIEPERDKDPQASPPSSAPAQPAFVPELGEETPSEQSQRRTTLKKALALENTDLEPLSSPLMPRRSPLTHQEQQGTEAEPQTVAQESAMVTEESLSLRPQRRPRRSRRRSRRPSKSQSGGFGGLMFWGHKADAQSVASTPSNTGVAANFWHRISQHPQFWLFLGLGLGASTGAIAVGVAIYALEKSTETKIEEVVVYSPPGTITIKANDGQILQEIGTVSHDRLQLGNIPPLVEKAFIASEDRRFYEHRGVDYQGILRALFVNIQAGDVVEGGSTITQQLARLVFLNQDRTFARKIKELRLAQKIESTLPKEQILERYLNLVYLGSGAYGVADASWAYFGKTPQQLTLGEAATLAGIVPAPSLYSPLTNKDLATQRRNEVLRKMAATGLITPQQSDEASQKPLVLQPSPLKRFNRIAPFFTDYILQEVQQKVKKVDLQAGGVVVTTTLNSKWQEVGEGLVSKSVQEYGGWQGFSEAALVAIDPRTGAIKTLVGGKDYQKNQFNRVTQARRQPGSTFKPILYATAIATGISPNKTYLDVPFTVNGYKPENFGDRYTGGPLSLRQALTNSVNVVAVRLLLDVGPNPVIALARRMGITAKMEPTYSLALGAWEVTPLEITSAYGTFAHKGVHVKPYAVQKVVNAKGQPLYLPKHQQTQALDPDSNAIMTAMMRSVVTSGTGRPAQLGDRQVAGKTGTSDEARDLWFIGYIPQLVTGVWLGNDNNKPTAGASSTAALIWGKFMGRVKTGMPVEYFPPEPKNPYLRKPSIKAEPMKARKIEILAVPNPGGVSPSTTGRNSSRYETAIGSENSRSRRSRRYRRSRTNLENTSPPETRRRRRRRPRTTPNVTQNASPPAPTDSGLPAPPAERKQE